MSLNRSVKLSGAKDLITHALSLHSLMEQKAFSATSLSLALDLIQTWLNWQPLLTTMWLLMSVMINLILLWIYRRCQWAFSTPSFCLLLFFLSLLFSPIKLDIIWVFFFLESCEKLSEFRYSFMEYSDLFKAKNFSVSTMYSWDV